MESEIFRNTFLAEEAIRAYPKLKAAYGELKRKPGGRRDPTTDAALRELPPEEQRQYEAVRRAIGRTGQLDHGAERLMVVRLHYFNDLIPLEDVAEKMSLTLPTVERYREDFIRCVEELLNISSCEGCIHFRKFTKQLKACFYCFDTGHLRLQGSTESGQGPCPYYKREDEPA